MRTSTRVVWFPLINLLVVCMLLSPVSVFAENPFDTAKPTVVQYGTFVIDYTHPKKQVSKDISTIFKHSGKFEKIVKTISNEFNMPGNITVKFKEGDGPLYDPGKKEIIMSYDFIFYLTTLYVDRYKDATDDEMMDFSVRSTMFLFYHEIAHSLIDMFQIPMVSNEETAADNLAVILAMEYNKDGFDIVMDSAELFDLLDMAAPKKYDESDYWDEHSLDAQRFYNILCMAYGREPKRVMAKLKTIQNKKLYEFVRERGDACIYQYDQQLKAWSQLLGPYFRN